MNKYLMLVGIVAVGVATFSTAALAATKYAAMFPRAAITAIVERDGAQLPIHKHVDGATTCYTFMASISCVK